jgi:poly(glycerol-phosphate) alpha-glucosyltransferase
MKVVMTTGSLSRDAGGLFESVRALGKGLAAQGVEVGVLGLWDENWERDRGVWLPLAARACRYLGPRALAWSPEMDAALAESGAGVVHLHGLWQYPSVVTRHLWKKRGTPYVISPRGMLDPWALRNSRWKKAVVAWLAENAVLGDAACLHALCEAEAQAMRDYGLRQRIEVVPNGVELPEFFTTQDTGSREGKKRLVFLGRIHPKKGLVGALRAWAKLRGKMGDWEFVIAGWDQGGHQGELKALCADLGLRIAERGEEKAASGSAEKRKALGARLAMSDASASADVIFSGPAFGEEKEALLRSAEAFILPSFSEGLPMSVLEAWAYGLPVVMTPECNLPEGVASGAALEMRNGEMAEGLSSLLEMSDAERREMGMRGRRLVEARFTWTKVAMRMREIYGTLR